VGKWRVRLPLVAARHSSVNSEPVPGLSGEAGESLLSAGAFGDNSAVGVLIDAGDATHAPLILAAGVVPGQRDAGRGHGFASGARSLVVCCRSGTGIALSVDGSKLDLVPGTGGKAGEGMRGAG